MINITLYQAQLVMYLGLFFIGTIAFVIGMSVLVTRVTGRDIRDLAAQTIQLAQKGIAEDVAGLVGNASNLLNAINEMVRSATGIGVFLTILGVIMMGTACWLVLQVSKRKQTGGKMTKAFSFIVGFKERLDEADWPWVIAALRESNVVWQSLEDLSFAQKALSTFSSQTERWTPGNLALLALDHPFPVDPIALDKDLRGKAIQYYRNLVENPDDYADLEFNLKQAGLVAIALLERRKRVGSWQGLPDELPPLSTRHWRTPLACLYGLSPDPLDLLRAWLSTGTNQAAVNLCLHALLSNPLQETQQHEVVKALLQDQQLPEVTHLLRRLEIKRPVLASRLAAEYLDGQQEFTLPSNANTTTGRLFQITQLLYQADLQAIAGNNTRAKSLRSLALENTSHLHRGFVSMLADDAARRGETQSALENWQNHKSTDLNHSMDEPTAAPASWSSLRIVRRSPPGRNHSALG